MKTFDKSKDAERGPKGQEEIVAYLQAQPRHTQLAPISVFIRRLALSIGISAVLLFGALLIGVAGYHWIAGLEWIDAILDASMILGGMGPVGDLTTNSAKLFASAYALFCGLVMVGAMGLVLAPILHRMLHKIHLDEQDYNGQNGGDDG
jgi:hypothetical protein